MTEEEWLSSTKASILADKLKRDSADLISVRKARHFGSSYLRAISKTGWTANELLLAALNVVERYADEQATTNETQDCLNGIQAVLSGPHGSPWDALIILLNGSGRLTGSLILTLMANNVTEYWQSSPQPAVLLRDIFGNPFRRLTLISTWLTSTVLALSQQMYDSRDFSAMPILADALQDAGCDNTNILNHCRQPGEHVRGCWCVDILLKRE